MTKKQQLYYLLKAFKKEEYDIATFCDELTLALYFESGGINELDDYEREYFDILGKIANRYSPFEEDYKLYPNAFSTSEEITRVFQEIYPKLIKE